MYKELAIFCRTNKYGYKYNVNHPKINKLYTEYKHSKGYTAYTVLSDKERWEFELRVDRLLKEKGSL